MSFEETTLWLQEQFRVWKEEVIRLSTKVTAVRLSDTTDRINGYTLDDLKDIIRAEVAEHETPGLQDHKLTPAQAGGVGRAEFGTMMSGKFLSIDMPTAFFNKDTVVLEDYDGIPYSDNFMIHSGTFRYRGYWYFLRNIEVEFLPDIPVQYLKLKITRVDEEHYPRYDATIINEGEDSTEAVDKVLIGVIRDGVPEFFTYLTFDGSRLSERAAGNAIPFAEGDPNERGSIHNSWF